MEVKEKNEIAGMVDKFSSEFNTKINEAAIILAAGHGKRIKSQTSKMLHKIWEIPTVERVYNACRNGITDINMIVVVGIKAKDVINVIGKREATRFAYQETQNGTGHAVQVALERIDEKLFAVYFFNTDAKNVFIWAEKLRVKIARKPITVVSKQNTYTVSIGVASTLGKLDSDEVFNNAELALQKAVEKGGNAVKNIN